MPIFLSGFIDEISHAFIDTLSIFVTILIVYFILSFIEGKLANKIVKSEKFSPLIGTCVGLIPQCGFSIIASDMYRKKYISLGTLIAVFIACSDEALPILLSNRKTISTVIPLVAVKFVIAILSGYIIDLLLKRKQKITKNETIENEEIHYGCCKHQIEHSKEKFVKEHLLHPLLHSLKICAYVLIINLIFSTIIYFVGENSIKEFLNNNIYLTPFLSSIIGLIPNCASSIIITELYVSSSLSFAATISGLICNAGLGLIYLLKDKKNLKNTLFIIGILLAISLLSGYIILFIEMSL